MGVYKHKEGHNELSCFVLEGGVSHYKFQWLKNGVPIEPNDNNSLVEYVEDMTKPIGLMLKLGKIQVSTIFREKNIFFGKAMYLFSCDVGKITPEKYYKALSKNRQEPIIHVV